MKMFMLAIATFLVLLRLVTSTTTIDIRYPQFFHQSKIDAAIEITEGKTAGSFIAFINLINQTNLNLNEWSLQTTDNDFRAQSNGISYSLVTNQLLDRERRNFYNFSLIAQQLTEPFERLSRQIYLRILDINDCSPKFNQSIYQTNLMPFTVQAFDCDEIDSDNSRISYSLSNYQDLFRINQTNGLIECLRTLNDNERYELIVVAYDHGKPSLSSTCLVQIQMISSTIERTKSKQTWINIEQSPENILILGGIIAASFLCLSLSTCFACCIKYKIKLRQQHQQQRKDDDDDDGKDCSSSSSSMDSSNDYQHPTIYDPVHTFYLPVQSELNDKSTLERVVRSSSTTSTPISSNENAIKVGSDDGCYCSSDMSSEQSNTTVLLNASKLTSKHVRFNEANPMNNVLQRFESLYTTSTMTDPCASYV